HLIYIHSFPTRRSSDLAHLHARKELRFAFILKHEEEHTILKMCEVLGVSPSGYYDYLKRLDREETKREAFNRHLDERILFHFTEDRKSTRLNSSHVSIS